MKSSIYFNPNRPLLEHGCQKEVEKFLAGRSLISHVTPHEEQKKKHDERYRKEVEYDARYTAKGKPCYKKYRQERVNEQSNCDAQYINNLQFYFGDGSQLHKIAKNHYAMDFVNTRGIDSECTAALKNVQVSSKKVTKKWLDETLQHGSTASRLRRAFSCIDIKFIDKEKLEETEGQSDGPSSKSPLLNVTILGVDSSIIFPDECQNMDASLVHREVAHCLKVLIERINSPVVHPGEIQISKVLFFTDELLAYVTLSEHNVAKTLRNFSSDFAYWFSNPDKKNFGTAMMDRDSRYWKWVNVVLFLPEHEKEGTMFRRARHVYNVTDELDLYFEIDSGKFTVVKSGPNTVRRLPLRFARHPVGIVEVSFQGLTSVEEVREQVNLIRQKGRAFVGDLKKITRHSFKDSQSFHNNSQRASLLTPWNDMHRAILIPYRIYPPPTLTTFFCEDRDCMGMCSMTSKKKNEPP